jgi:hypothetical protein
MVIRSKVFKEVGMFDENMFMYAEDTDLTRRINRVYKTLYYPHVTIYHDHQKASHKSFKMLFAHLKTTIYYFNKWGWFFDKEREEINKRIIKQI